MKKYACIVLAILSVSISCYCQKSPIKFGDVSLDELKMTSCYMDSTAPAVVLCDYGYLRASNVTFTRNIRIKILKKEGYEWANRSFKSDLKGSIRGITSNLEDGKIVQEKLKADAIRRTRIIDNYYLLNVAMPNVKVGSVIDLEFSFQGIPDEWRFQEEIPVLHSELIMEESPFIQLRKNFSGYERLTYSTPTKWIARDMSAFKSEPIMGPVENYITKLKFDIKAIYNYNFSTTWENVSKILLESDHFGMPAVSTLFLNSVSSKLSEKFKNKEDLLRAAYDTIRERIVWNKVNQLTSPNGNLANVYQMKVGNSGEVNLLLYKLLNKLGFDVTPVALSTRDNGNISEFFPSLRQFNYAIIHVRIEEKEYLLDATEKYLPFTMLPLRCLNTKGLYVNKDFGVWLPLTTNKKNKDFTIYDLAIDNDLNLNGNVSMMMSDYAAYDFRKKYFEFNSKNEYIESYLQRMPGLTISDLNIQDLDSIYKPVKATQTINITNEVSRVDNSLYIIPLYFSDLKENPFKLNTRKYPVDFEVLTDKTMMLNLTIPKGYAPFALPESVSLKLPGNSAVFMYDVVNTGDKIRLTTKLMINKVSFIPDEYSELKEFYNQILKKESESIILKKI